MARLWNEKDDEKWGDDLRESLSAPLEPISVPDLTFRDVFFGCVAQVFEVMRAWTAFDEARTTLAATINETCNRRAFLAWLAVPIPDPPEQSDTATAKGR